MKHAENPNVGTKEARLVFRMSAVNPGYGKGILGSYFTNDLGAGTIFESFCATFRQKTMPRSSANATMLSPCVSRSSAICRGSQELFLHTSCHLRPLLVPRVHSRSVSIWGRSTSY